jgi:protocatechuate 4,5-dioxygenase beta chain
MKTIPGFINPEFDGRCLDALVSGDTGLLTSRSIPEIVELTGSQGVEIVNWLAMRGALSDRVVEIHRNYHIPISNTAAAVQALAAAPVTTQIAVGR